MRSGGVFAVDGNHMSKPFGGRGVRRSAARVGGVADDGPECVFSYAPIIGGHASRQWDASFGSPPPRIFRRIRLQRRHGSSESGGAGMVPVFHGHRRMPCGCPRPVDMAVPPYPLSDDRTCSTVRRRIPIAVQAAWQPSLVLRRICEGIPDVACGRVPQDSSKIWEPSCRSARLPRNLPLYNPLRLFFYRLSSAAMMETLDIATFPFLQGCCG